jgi:hypothetical protein
MLSFCLNNNPSVDALPPYIKVRGELSDTLTVNFSEQVQTTASSMSIDLESTNQITTNLNDLYRIEWYRKEADKPNSANPPASKKTMVQNNKYLCSPKGNFFK